MTYREWQNVKTIINGMFEYAFDKHLLKENPCDRLKITVKYRQVNKKTAKTEVYKNNEYNEILAYLDKMYNDTDDSVFLAVKFQFFTGVRVGELVALRWEDVDLNEKIIHVHSGEANQPYMDSLKKWHNKRVVVPHTKTYTDRDVQLLPKALEILELIQHNDEFLFTRDGKRITERQVNYVLEKYAERMGTITKSSHKLRKTYASRIKAGGVSLDTIRKDLGHKNILIKCMRRKLTHYRLVVRCSKSTEHKKLGGPNFQDFPIYKKSARRDSNPRPSPWQGDTPPLSHSRIIKLFNYTSG